MKEDKLKLKVCGMREAEDLQQLALLAPEYVGFIFYNQSPRYAAEVLDPAVAHALPETIKKVGVFVNSSTREILEKVKAYQLDLVQLHGGETPEQCQELKKSGIKIIKAFAIGNFFDFDKLLPFTPFVDYFLFDTKGKNHGGNGETFDWGILRDYSYDIPFFLSGGIDLEHVSFIHDLPYLNLHALDINSKFEIRPGIKDMKKLQLFKDNLKVLNSQ